MPGFSNRNFLGPVCGRKICAGLSASARESAGRYDADEVHRLIEEAQLFIEASHACADKLRERKAANLKL